MLLGVTGRNHVPSNHALNNHGDILQSSCLQGGVLSSAEADIIPFSSRREAKSFPGPDFHLHLFYIRQKERATFIYIET